MAYIPKQFATWISATANNRPDDGEQIVFHLKTDTKRAWHRGIFNDTEQTVEIRHSAYVYESFLFGGDGVDYWMRIPSL